MQQRNVARELGLLVASVAVLVHWLDAGPAIAATVLVAGAAALGTGPLVGQSRPWRMPAIPMVLPALAAFSIAGIARLVAPWPWLPLVFLVGWAVVTWTIRLETAPEVLTAPQVPGLEPDATADADASPDADADADAAPEWTAEPDDGKDQSRNPAAGAGAGAGAGRGGAVAAAVDLTPPTIRMRPKRRAEYDLPQIVAEPVVVGTPEMPPHPRPLAVRATGLTLAFLGFVAAGGFVPGALAIDHSALSQTYLAQFVVLNALVAAVVGYRIAALASPYRMDRIVRIVAVGQYAVPVAVGAAVLRTLALPLLFIPALLGVITYLLTDLRESPEPITQNRRLVEELAVLGVAALAVVAWGLLGR
jgi:hypothetical protein